jgi:peptidoglycan hydrolase CwlO-like protein
VSDSNDLKTLIEAIRSQPQQEAEGIVSGKHLNILVMGVMAAAGALVWSTVTEEPLKNADSFAAIQQQTTEIKTTVLEMKSLVNGLAEKLDQNQRQTGDLQAKVSGIEASVNTNRESIKRLEDRVGALEQKPDAR